MEKLTFGKYKGKTLTEVLVEYEDASYIIWMDENVDSVSIPKDMLARAKKIVDDYSECADLFHDDAGDRI